jgi:hypothetical protein
MTQRWRDGRASYRPKGEPIDPRSYEVALMPKHEKRIAKAFVERHHYAGTFPAARRNVGLYTRGELVGVASFSHPCNEAVLDVLPDGRNEGIELGRLVLLDSVPANGETWFLARAFAALVADGTARSVVSFADPLRRTDIEGTVTMPGHVGTIYQALNGIYTGRGRGRWIQVLANGRTYNERTSSKAKAGHRGRAYAIAQLVAAGATPPTEAEDIATWVDGWVRRLCRRVKHPGNHRYVWGVDRRASRAVTRHLERRGVRLDLPRPKSVET